MASIQIVNVKVFDGINLTDADKVVFEDGVISGSDAGEISINGQGATIIPGFIDSHVHLYEKSNLEELCKHGVTTALDMANRSVDLIRELKGYGSLTNVLSCCYPAFTDGSALAQKMGFPAQAIVKSVDDADRFVKEQIASGADYIKLILEDNGVNEGIAFPEQVLRAVVENAHKYGKKVIAHVASPASYQTATDAGMDVLTHIPFTGKLSRKLVKQIAFQKIVCVPTIYTMKGIVEMIKKKVPLIPFSYKIIQKNMARMYKYDVTFLAGTDANMNDPTSPFSAPYGSSFLGELELMVACGLSPVEVLQSATSVPAQYWGLCDRGIIKAGKRADLILIEGDPTRDIHAVRNIKRVWIQGEMC